MIVRLKKAHNQFLVTDLCRVFGISESTYYYSTRQFTASISKKVLDDIAEIVELTDNTYGRRRMHVELNKLGYHIGVYKTAALMKEANVTAITPKKQHYYPNNGEECRYAPNLLKRQFNPETLNTHWVGDITYVRTNQGWSYLACVLDLGSREIVGWAVSQSPDAKLAKAALNDAIKKQRPRFKKLMFHSDQGVQYSANLFTRHLARLKITQSMSRRGNCWDNAVMERFFRSLKSERLNHLIFINHGSLVHCIEKYIRFYNYKRLHSANDYLTPVQKANELKKAA